MSWKTVIALLSLLLIAVLFLRLQKPEPEEPAKPPEVAIGLTMPRLPAPKPARNPSVPALEVPQPTNWLALLEGKSATVARDKVEDFLSANRRSADSLLGAFRATGDAALLQEATNRFPNEPRVAFTAWARSQSPEEARRWLDTLKAADPDNALGNYLSALQHFKAGDGDAAVKDLLAASQSNGWRDYILPGIQAAEEAYLAAGYSPVEAKAIATFSMPMPHLSRLRELGRQMVDMAGQYNQAGDPGSSDAMMRLAADMSRRLGENSRFLIQDLVAVATESQMLKAMDPNFILTADGLTVQRRLEHLAAERTHLKEYGEATPKLAPGMSEQEVLLFLDRVKITGELDAMEWLKHRRTDPNNGTQAPEQVVGR